MQNKYIICLLIPALFFSFGCKKKEQNSTENSISYCVVTASKLLVREKPDKNSAIIDSVRNRHRIDVTGLTGIKETINNISGEWVKVELLNHKQGYAFNGYMKPIDKFTDNDYNKQSDISPELKKCYSYNNYNDSVNCQHDLEKTIISKNNYNVKREDNKLIFTSLNGNKMELTDVDDPDSDGATYYHFKKFIPEIACYLIDVSLYEGGMTYLVSQIDNKKREIFGNPVLSPSGKYFVTNNADIEAGYTANGFELFQINADKSITSIFKLEPSWGPYDCKWIGDNRIEIVRQEFLPELNLTKSLSELIYENGKWTLYE